eukprot:3697965-Pyramimonas_sp.AAC.1
MMHIQKERDRLKTLASQLQMANALRSIEPGQCSVPLQALSEVSGFLRNARRSQVFYSSCRLRFGVSMDQACRFLLALVFQELRAMIGQEARLRQEDQRDSYQAWMRFQRG